ncbi:tail fiber assembly protein [Sphingobium aromaticiconvertens]|uniref:tail fiber assembly protein n=1 Tax=Sphingobium aromaticiconvertens TaxID=365341 RepID=UPI0030194D34
MRVWFDEDGFLLFAMAGGMEVESPAWSAMATVSDDTNVNTLFLDNGQVIERQPIEIASDRNIIALDQGQSATFDGLPDPAWISVNGERQRVTGGVFNYASPAAEAVRIELVGPHTSNAVVLTFAVASALLDLVRVERDRRLTACDWTQVPDNSLTSEQQGQWRLYRQALRDLPGDQPDATLETAIWPQEP